MLREFLSNHPVITETILEDAKGIMSANEDRNIYRIYQRLNVEHIILKCCHHTSFRNLRFLLHHTHRGPKEH
jgi:hypothetical protein